MSIEPNMILGVDNDPWSTATGITEIFQASITHWFYGTVVLSGRGCRVDGGWNCTKACLDTMEGPSMVWNSPDALYTFYNCISYPMISTAAAHGQISTEDLGLLEKFDIIVNDTMPANASNVDAWPVISGCLREMCFRYKGQGNEAACPLSHYVFRSWGDAEVNDWEFLQMDAICVTDPLAFNADIGGPGVLLSFSQQSALLLAMWLFLSLMRCTHFLAYCQLWYGHRRYYHRSKRWRLAIDAAARMTTQWTFPNVTAATISALSTFYATQVFFLITLQAASHFAINNSILLGARNFREVFVSFGLLAFISASGMHPVILALFTLRKDQQGLSWFPLLISSACALISWISGLVTYSRIFKGTDLLQDGYNPQQCGGINPGKNCLTEDFAVSNKYFSQSGDLWWDTPGLSNVMSPVSGVATFAAILLLIVEKLILEKEKVISVEPFSQKRLWRARTWMRTVGQFNMYRYLGLLLAIAEAWHVYATFCLMFIVSSVLRWPSYDITETWTLGQIMAVAIWAPVMIDWIRVLLESIIKDRIASRKKGRRTDYIEMGPTSSSPNAGSQVQLRPPSTDNRASQAGPDPSPPRLSLQSIGSNTTTSWGIPPGAPSSQLSPNAQV